MQGTLQHHAVTFSGGGTNGVGAAATSTIGDGVVGIVTVTSGGAGYTENPTIFTNQIFTGVSTVSAAATAIVSAAGTISAIHITNAGLAYTVAPTISISSPGTGGSGTFSFNEIVTGSSSGTTGKS